MGKINGCLKCLFIFFNIVFLILGCVLIYVAVKATEVAVQVSAFGGPGLGWIWVIAIGIFGLSSLGIFAACSEKSLFVKIFAGFMAAGLIIMLIFGTVVAVSRNKVKAEFDQQTKEIADKVLEDEQLKAFLQSLQPAVQCCGVNGPADWGTEIPPSCDCSNANRGFGNPTCKARPSGSTGPDLIYAEGCGSTIFGYVDIIFKVVIGILFGFAITALLGLLISLLMIHQISRHDGMGGLSIAMKG